MEPFTTDLSFTSKRVKIMVKRILLTDQERKYISTVMNDALRYDKICGLSYDEKRMYRHSIVEAQEFINHNIHITEYNQSILKDGVQSAINIFEKCKQPNRQCIDYSEFLNKLLAKCHKISFLINWKLMTPEKIELKVPSYEEECHMEKMYIKSLANECKLWGCD